MNRIVRWFVAFDDAVTIFRIVPDKLSTLLRVRSGNDLHVVLWFWWKLMTMGVDLEESNTS